MRQACGTMSRSLQRRLAALAVSRLWLLSALTVGFIAVMALTSVVGFVFSSGREARLTDYRVVSRDVRGLQQGLIDAETGVRGFVLAGRVDYLEPYFHGLQVLDERGPRLLPGLDEYAARTGLSAEPMVVTRRIAELRRIWADVVTLAGSRDPLAAQGVLQERGQKRVMDELRGFIGAYLDHRVAESERQDGRLARVRTLLLCIDLSGALIAIAALTRSFRRTMRETRQREVAMAESARTTLRVEQLFGMTSLLQSAPDRQDANEVLRATAVRLLPGHSGRLYVFNNSQDRLELSTAWGRPAAAAAPQECFAPQECWAMKGGKPHLNLDDPEALRCRHPLEEAASLEIPMAAGGQVYGLLVIGPGEHGDAAAALGRARPAAMALADAMSLALSSMALRDQLRNQAIRDPLTGLYNRRFLDETLERLSLDARRRKVPLAAIMIDLDHFKRLNDQHGHAAGDTVLRNVSLAILAMLRTTDIACRYGGEELAVLLPDCPLEMALAKAEQLRAAIAGLPPGPSGATITASLGVSVIPDACSTAAGLLSSADGALYKAKKNGRNRVEQAGLPALAPDGTCEAPRPVLAWPSPAASEDTRVDQAVPA